MSEEKQNLAKTTDVNERPMQQKVGQQNADIKFLLNRAMKADVCLFSADRDTGASSNSIVAIAYGLKSLDEQSLPSDNGDLEACRKMWDKLPDHRKTEDAMAAMANAENYKKSIA